MSTVFDKEEWPIKREEKPSEYYGMSNEVVVYDYNDKHRSVYIAIPAGFFTYLKSVGVENPAFVTLYLEGDERGVYFGYQRQDRISLSVDLWSYKSLPPWARK